MVDINQGPGRWDTTCLDNPRSVSHYVFGASVKNSERFLSSGNERAGYHLRRTDSFKFLVDLMNMNIDDRVVYLTMAYDIIDGALPAGWSDIKAIWLDANNCGSSVVHSPQEKGTFTITSKPWILNVEGEIMSLGGHLHDLCFKLSMSSILLTYTRVETPSRSSPRTQAQCAPAKPNMQRTIKTSSKTRRAPR